MTTNFAGWEQISKKLDRLFNQYGVTEDIPDNADIAEFFKTAEFNTIYRARPNRGILNTCIPNTSYSFYSREANNIVGYDTQGNLYIGGFVNLSFIGWRQIAMSDEHHIKTYTTLEQLNLSDDEMAEDDFFNNIQTIINKMPAYSDLSFYCGIGANFTKSLNLQLIKDGISGAIENMEGILKLERRGHINWGTTLVYQRNGGDLMVRGLYDVNGSNAVLYPFKVIATTEIFRETIIPLNGWGLSYGYVSKVGNQVSINATMSGGIRTSGTTIFTMPSSYLPIGQAVFPVVSNSNNHLGRVVALKTGEFKVYGLEDSSDLLCFSGTYTVA